MPRLKIARRTYDRIKAAATLPFRPNFPVFHPDDTVDILIDEEVVMRLERVRIEQGFADAEAVISAALDAQERR